DRPGLATGMAIMGFGGGALIASPLSSFLLQAYDPNYSTAASWIPSGAAVGLLFLTLAGIYFVYMMLGAFFIRVPADGWVPAGFKPEKLKQRPLVSNANVSAKNAIKTPQFWL
ncbi:MFS transporter, partial [Vibrio vulnificus]